jgi:hypothetical protein
MVVVIKKSANREDIKKALAKLSKSKVKKGIDVREFCGTVKFKENPLVLQKKWLD